MPVRWALLQGPCLTDGLCHYDVGRKMKLLWMFVRIRQNNFCNLPIGDAIRHA
jgi:hypothetical protein